MKMYFAPAVTLVLHPFKLMYKEGSQVACLITLGLLLKNNKKKNIKCIFIATHQL